MSTANSRNFDDYVAAEMRLDREAIDRLKRRYPEWEFVLRSGGQRTLAVMPEPQTQLSLSATVPLIQAVERVISAPTYTPPSRRKAIH